MTRHMPCIVAVANQKGGVGKTTTVVNLGVALAEMEIRTLVVDLDPQGALSAGLGVNGDTVGETLYTAMMDPDLPVKRVVHPVKTYLDLIPSNIELASAEMELVAELRREYTLSRVLAAVEEWYDYVLIDCPPSLGLLFINALCACHKVVVPMQSEFFAMRGIQLLLDAIHWVKSRANPELELGGILVTMYSTGTVHAREVVDQIRSTFGDKVFDTVIYKSIHFAEASVASQALVEYAPKHKGAQAYRELARAIVDGGAAG
jgi:chromosome partitioning protein